jgi:general nucleoside transport system permease protein
MTMFGYRLERSPAPVWVRFFLPLLAILITFIIVSLVVAASGVNPVAVFYEMLIKPLTKRSARFELLVQVTPLLLCGVAVTFAFVSGYYNIGADGQLYAGALAGALIGTTLHNVPAFLSICIMLLAGFLGGVSWAFLPALLKVRLGVDEVVTTLLLNSVMRFFIDALLNGPWRDPVSGWPHSPEIAVSAWFPQLFARTRVHLGFILAIVAALFMWWLLRRTRFGLELRATGLGMEAARFMGIPVKRRLLQAALISGGIAGLAGVSEVAGIHHYILNGISADYGYTGVIIATFGGLSSLGVTLASFFLALIDTGALSTSRSLGVPDYLGDIIQATLLIVTLAVLLLSRYRFKRQAH